MTLTKAKAGKLLGMCRHMGKRHDHSFTIRSFVNIIGKIVSSFPWIPYDPV